MHDDPAKAFDHLYGTLAEFETRFIETSLKACAFFLLVMGWILTAPSARNLVASSGVTRTAAILGLVFTAGAYVFLSVRVIKVTRQLNRELDTLQYFPQSYYQFRVFNPWMAIAMIAIAVSPCVILIVFLLR